MKNQIDMTEREFGKFLNERSAEHVLDYIKSQGIRFAWDQEQIRKDQQTFLRSEYLKFGCNECCLDEDNRQYSHRELRWVWDVLCGKHQALESVYICKNCKHELPNIKLCA